MANKDDEENELSYVLHAGFGRNGAKRELLVNGVCYRGGKGRVKYGCVFLLNSCAMSLKGSNSTEKQSGASFSVLLSADRSHSSR